MLRDFKFLRRNSGKNTNTEEVENVPVNPRDSLNPQMSTDPSRPPLNAIQEPSRIPKSVSDQDVSSFKASKIDRTPTKPKPKHSDTSMPFRTPEKQGAALRSRFNWAQKSSTRAASRANLSYSECNSTQSTPTKSVNKPPNPSFCLASGSRALNAGARMANYAALSKGIPSSSNLSTVVNTVEVPYFELKEDPSFWMEHNVQESAQSITWIGQPETRFMFDHVACEAIDQETLFRMVGLPMVENCLSGYNSCMFAYGQTGSGKTYTMLGEIEELEVKPSPNRGMTPRIFEFLFARIRAEEESRRDEHLKYNCKCSFLEIYNEQITDLLDPSSTNLMLREDMKKGVYVENLSEFEVHTVGDILQLLTQGSSNRKVAATNMNRESSRSHSVFTCVIESRWEKDSATNFRFARLNLVDLAGSERQKSSGAEGERLKEAANINKSLSTLGHVIMVLVDVAHGKPRHVPYRDSRLTFLLQDSLGGNSKTTIIANVSPSICSAAETLNTLKFAQRAKLIQNNAIINEDSSGDVTALKHQIQLLKLLEAELDDAKVVAAQKTIEASCILEKFEEVQDTVKEADVMINELMIANETLKLNAHELKAKENHLTNERNILAKEVQSLKLSNNLKDQNYRELEKQYDTDFVTMKRMLSELEDVISEFQTTSMEEWMSVAAEFSSVKSQLHDSTRSIRTLLEEVWSEIIVKDCAVSVLHLCHMGILLETANGLNAENGLLHHGLCESNSIISELREHNFRSRRELEICRVLKGKLLADIKKSFDRISSKVDEAGEVTLKLTSFEKKIKDLQFQEEVMLHVSNNMGSELAVLMKELDRSNKHTMESILDQEKLLKEKDELFQHQEENFMIELSAKDFELLILSSELKQTFLLKTDAEKTCISTLEVLEDFKKDIVFKSLDAASSELLLLDQECKFDKLMEDFKMKESALETSSSHISELYQQINTLHEDIHLLKAESHRLQIELERKHEELGGISCLEKEKVTLQDHLKDLKAKYGILLQELEDKKADLQSSLRGTHELGVENQRLRDKVLVLENCIAKLDDDVSQARVEIKNHELSESVIKDDLCLRIQDLQRQLGKVNSLKEENISLRNEMIVHEINESEYLNAFNLTILKTVDFAESLDTVSCKIVDLIKDKFIEVDDTFQKIVNELGRTDQLLEHFEYVENLAMQMDSEILSLQMELSRKDDILKGLLFDLSLLQESASNSKDQKDEMEKLLASFRALEKEFELKSLQLDKAVGDGRILEHQLQERIAKISTLELDLTKDHEIINSLSNKNAELLAGAKDALDTRNLMEKELLETRIKIENLEMEVAEMEIALSQMSETTESLKSSMDTVTFERDELEGKVLTLTKELELARALAEENEAIALLKLKRLTLSKEKLRGNGCRERNLSWSFLESKNKCTPWRTMIQICLAEKEKNLQEALQRLQLLEKEIASRDEEISQCKAHISELNLHAEAQASEYKQKFKALEAMVELVKLEAPATSSSSNKLERNASKPRGSGSPFKCIGLGLVQQIKSERDEELTAGRQRIEELEALASGRQKEIFMLKARLAATESMTHDVIRDLLGVKLNMKSYAQLHSIMEAAQHQNVKSEVKEQEIVNLKQQINEFVKERNGWLEEIERKQAEMMAAHVALEKLRQHDQLLATENEMLKMENANHKKRVVELELEILKESLAMAQEENNLLRCQNEDLSIKLRKTEAILSRVKEELAQFRAANGRNPYINFDEEHQLEKELKETEEERLQLAQKLLGLCTTVLKAAGITQPTSEISPSAAEAALEQLENRVICLERELQDVKLKNRISEERIRLSELRPQSATASSRADDNYQVRNGASQPQFLSPFDR
ncbi:Kinesin-like protein KIN-12D [Sesamum angolense]|uniref:Kinesin-like protein KIN-12D n=1 Tax=Sesamum angolense TaxID=2727404 RepID=A0AAE1WYA1_9LAMI|nr:Kinesin-like protein KIN-12D [Sesamum angolense]